MVDGLFCATLTGRRGGHTPFVQAGAETTDTGAEAVLIDRRFPVYSWLLPDARTPVWFSRCRLSGQGVVLKRIWMENLA